MGGKILETRTYTRDAAAAALIASLYPDAPPLAFVHSYGCQQNVNDGEKLRGVLQDIGFGLCDTVEQADLILFNTCAVREHAEQRVFGNVGALKKLKEANPRLIIGVCGCMAQQPHIVEKLKQSYPYVDLVFGVDGIDPEFGMTTTNMLEASLNRAMIEAAQKVVVLADSSKFGRRGFSKICDLESVDRIITDSNIQPLYLERLRERGIEVTVVDL